MSPSLAVVLMCRASLASASSASRLAVWASCCNSSPLPSAVWFPVSSVPSPRSSSTSSTIRALPFLKKKNRFIFKLHFLKKVFFLSVYCIRNLFGWVYNSSVIRCCEKISSSCWATSSRRRWSSRTACLERCRLCRVPQWRCRSSRPTPRSVTTAPVRHIDKDDWYSAGDDKHGHKWDMIEYLSMQRILKESKQNRS